MIRAMTATEIVAGLRRAAVVCVEQGRRDWHSVDVCRAEATFDAALDWSTGSFVTVKVTPDHAATFLLLCAEANDDA
jgi:hypothetical protein